MDEMSVCIISASYAVEKCDVLTQEMFSACHEYVSPVGFQLQCRADVCKCGALCLCSILAHYARTCRRHGVIIEFRSHLPECGESNMYRTIQNFGFSMLFYDSNKPFMLHLF